jgi:2-oxoglutarate ferredoxin oxidoreductase subunit delta
LAINININLARWIYRILQKEEELILAKGILTINTEECKGCGICVTVCPKKLLILDESYINVKGINPCKITDADECIACASCAIMCPDAVIKVEKE